LAEKLVQYITDLKIPASTQNRIREELEWTVVPSEEKTVRLLKIEHFNAIQFKRLTQHIEEIIKAGHQAPAAYLAEHFFDSCTRDAMPAAEELGRIPEFVNCCPNLRPESWKNGVDRLLVKLATPLDQVRHLQVANGLFAIAQALARYEAFDTVNEVGAALELQLAGSEGHDACCKPALRNLLTKHVLDRILEIYQQKREDQEFARLAPVLLRRAGAAGVEKVFHELENQENAAQRMSLLRLITRIGAPAVEFAVERLKDERWYIVRNACKLLSDLRDPHIVEHLGHLLEHKDERVQKAALSGVIDSRLPGRGLVLATHLGHLNGALLEDAATELIYLRDAGCIKPLVDIFEMEPQNCKAEVAALQVLATLTDESSSAALLQVVLNGKIDTVIRKTALKSLLRKTGPKYSRELRSFATQHGSDALAGDVAAALSAVGEG
jgi:HEAT repeat protein